ncbi:MULTISPECIES: hypothetical protein [Leptospira]|uniref:hypothetical protein n=1 Tax=Leptospira TaxID=171 RepID=UPI000C2AE37A|nr:MULTISPECIES: hypothetical protein [Leptospira]PJZ87427.1 hypothetical protein CH368_16925 [Leptospira levettii]TGN08613.1 hypothetical protein EHR07_03595 [Leptospira bandrabouensis]
MAEAIKSFLGTWKLQLIVILVIAILVAGYFTFRSINKKIGDHQNETIPLNKTNTPGPDVFDDLCLYLTDQPCP